MGLGIEQISTEYDTQIATLAHVGANEGQEVEQYLQGGVQRLFLFEPLPAPFEVLKRNCLSFGDRADFHFFNVALGENEDVAEMHVSTGNAAASSLLKPSMTRRYARKITFEEKKEPVQICRLDSIPELKNGVDVLVVDTQGYELSVLKGSQNILKKVKFIICELHRKPTYAGSATVLSVDEYLNKNDFVRVETHWFSKYWGDALYINTKHIKKSVNPVVVDYKKKRLFHRLLGLR